MVRPSERKSMKRTESDWYEVMNLDGNGYLDMRYYTNDNSLEGARYAIDTANQRAVKLGYRAEQFLIVHTEFYKYTDDGRFVKSERLTQAIEVYPAEL